MGLMIFLILVVLLFGGMVENRAFVFSEVHDPACCWP